MKKLIEKPRAYLTNLGKYNEGFLIGKWINLPCSKKDFREHLKQIGIDGIMYEEYFVTDYENIYYLDEFCTLSEMNSAAKRSMKINEILAEYFNQKEAFSNDYYEVRRGIYSFVLDLVNEDYEDWKIYQKLESLKIFIGTIGPPTSCLENFGYYLLEELDYLEYNSLPDKVKDCIDVEKFAKNEFFNCPIAYHSKCDNDEDFKIIIME